MSAPQTMFQLLGRSYAPANLAKATLLVIDPQEEYRSGQLQLPDVEAAIREIARLLQAARSLGSPVIHARHLGIPGGVLDPQGPRGLCIAGLEPLPGEAQVEKRSPNAFANTPLHELLQASGRLDLIVCGFMTHSSVSTTVRAARDFGYRSTLVASACATRDLPFGDQLIPAAQVQQISLAELADNFAMVVSDVDALQ